MGYNLKSGGLHFLKVFYHLKILGWTSGFRTIDDLSSAHWDETEFRWWCQVYKASVSVPVHLEQLSHLQVTIQQLHKHKLGKIHYVSATNI